QPNARRASGARVDESFGDKVDAGEMIRPNAPLDELAQPMAAAASDLEHARLVQPGDAGTAECLEKRAGRAVHHELLAAREPRILGGIRAPGVHAPDASFFVSRT